LTARPTFHAGTDPYAREGSPALHIHNSGTREAGGEIYDEFDRDIASAHHEPDGALVLPGSFPVHDLPDLGVELPEGPYVTVAGLVLDRLGHLPSPGESVLVDGWSLEVLEVAHNAIQRLRLRRAGDADRGGVGA
jgi:putative hemolysin